MITKIIDAIDLTNGLEYEIILLYSLFLIALVVYACIAFNKVSDS
jgi:hypothetical protein